MTDSALSTVLNALADSGAAPRSAGAGWTARCPAHDDASPSLSINKGDDGRVLLHCHAGCHLDDILLELKLAPGDLFDQEPTSKAPMAVAEYPYTDEAGALLFAVVRFEPKTFKQKRPDGSGGWIWRLDRTRRVLYRLPTVVAAASAGKTIYIVEGEKDVHAAEAAGAVATTCPGGAGKWRDEYTRSLAGANAIVVADRDDPGRNHATQVADSLQSARIPVQVLEPAVGKDLTDHLAAGATLDELAPPDAAPADNPPPRPYTLQEVHAVFQKWLGPRYDMQVLDVCLSVAAAAQLLDGDPAWLQVVGGSGVGKTESLSVFASIGAVVVSGIGSPAALLSGTPATQKAKDATGGLLRQLGARGLLVIKDFTTVLSMSRDDRAKMLAGLREVHDGHYVRTVGTDGGRTITWQGRITILSGVTGSYDEHHAVTAAMGDRFLLLRLDSEDPDVRRWATRQALRNNGDETLMRSELASAVAGFFISLTPAQTTTLPGHVEEEILDLADVVARTRSQVARDFKGDPEWRHPPEMPTRVAKQLKQIYLGAITIGMPGDDAVALVRRLAHDSIPPVRRIVLLDLAQHPASTTKRDVSDRTGIARTTVDRTLRELELHGLVHHEAVDVREAWRWHPDESIRELALLQDGFGQRPGNVPPTPEDDDAHTKPLLSGPTTIPTTPMGDFSGLPGLEEEGLVEDPQLPPGAGGPCTGCGRAIHRYGPGGRPRCAECEAAS